MATILIENFNSYPNGDLNGNGPWGVQNSVLTVQSARVHQEGARAVVATANGGARRDISANGVARTDGAVSLRIMNANASLNAGKYFIVYFRKSPTIYIALEMYESSGVAYLRCAGVNIVQPMAAGQWYDIVIQWRSSPSCQYRARVDGGAFTSWVAGAGDWSGADGLDQVYILQREDSGNMVYLDNIADVAPDAPTSLIATAISSSEIDLSWTAAGSVDEDGFKIERKTGVGGVYAQIDTVGAGVTTYQNIGLAPETNYWYRVRAYNDGGDSGYSNEAEMNTLNVGWSGGSFMGIESEDIESAMGIDIADIDKIMGI